MKLPISRTFGYYNNLKDAIKAVEENRGSMQECLYNFIVIEAIDEGIHPKVIKEYWFKWKNNHWKPFGSSYRKPKKFIGICNLALG